MNSDYVSIIGCANVGKSSLFNALSMKTKQITFDRAGITRDCAHFSLNLENNKNVTLIDTPGFSSSIYISDQDYDPNINKLSDKMILEIIEKSSIILYVIDSNIGLTNCDINWLKKIYKYDKTIIAIANKVDKEKSDNKNQIYKIDAKEHIFVSAIGKIGLKELKKAISENTQQYKLESTNTKNHENSHIENNQSKTTTNNISQLNNQQSIIDIPTNSDLSTDIDDEKQTNIEYENTKKQINNIVQFAIIGKPNVGKSTLVNSLTKTTNQIVSDNAGTTRDSSIKNFIWNNKKYQIIDTAGIRRQSKITDQVETLAVSQALNAIRNGENIIIYMIDCKNMLSDQDFKIIDMIQSSRKKIIIAINKIDSIAKKDLVELKKKYLYQLSNHNYISCIFISAKNKNNINQLIKNLNIISKSNITATTSKLTRLLEEAVEAHQPPMHNNRRIKPRFAHIKNNEKFTIIIKGKQVSKLSKSYNKYLAKHFQKRLHIKGIEIKIITIDDHNPYA